MRRLMKYKVITEELMKNLIEFLDEIQFEATSEGMDAESMQKINFCNWAINELINSYDALLKETKAKKSADKKEKKDTPDKPKIKTRDDYIEETFLDWNLPEMTDKDFEKLVDQFDGFLRSWENEYLKKNPDSKMKKRDETFKPNLDDVSQYMSLDEIKEYLLDDEELTEEERFELYYEAHERIQIKKSRKKELKNAISLDKMLKDLNIARGDK